jgi:hypothetical protein
MIKCSTISVAANVNNLSKANDSSSAVAKTLPLTILEMARFTSSISMESTPF